MSKHYCLIVDVQALGIDLKLVILCPRKQMQPFACMQAKYDARNLSGDTSQLVFMGSALSQRLKDRRSVSEIHFLGV